MWKGRGWRSVWAGRGRSLGRGKRFGRISTPLPHSTDGRRFLSSDPFRPSVYTPFLRRFTDEPARDLAETIALYHEVRRAHRGSVWAQDAVVDRVNRHCPDIVGK